MYLPVFEALQTSAETEIERKRRLGGFLSVALFAPVEGRRFLEPHFPDLRDALQRMADRARPYDMVGMTPNGVIMLVLPDTSLYEVLAVGRRWLVQLTSLLEDASPGPLAAGVATIFGDVEGGLDALVGAAADALDGAVPGQVAPSRSFKGEPRLLVVDDDSSFAEALAESIQACGWRADPCTQTSDARDRVRLREYYGLFVDLVLRDGSGLAILEESLRCFPRRPAILMTGHNPPQQAIVDALALGPVMFVRKPIIARDLESALGMIRLLLPGMRPT